MNKAELQNRLRRSRPDVWNTAIHHLCIVLLDLEGTIGLDAAKGTPTDVSRSIQYLKDLMEAIDALQET